jgi:hypothetical protein
MWRNTKEEALRVLKQCIKGTGMPRITKYLFARGCSQDFESIAAMRKDLETAGFTPSEVTRFLSVTRRSRKTKSGSFETDHMTLTTASNSLDVNDPNANDEKVIVKIVPKVFVDLNPIVEELEMKWVMYDTVMEGCVIQREVDMEEGHFDKSKKAQIQEDMQEIGNMANTIASVAKELVRLGARKPTKMALFF